ncbi:MAG: hypothetical protein RQ761_12000 [Bacteroidales bacterium]|nr:hypothetical protein [Bacteroidales bacterium]
MDKLDQLEYIDRFLYDDLSMEELRALVYALLQDESLFRSFRLYSSMKGAFV